MLNKTYVAAEIQNPPFLALFSNQGSRLKSVEEIDLFQSVFQALQLRIDHNKDKNLTGKRFIVKDIDKMVRLRNFDRVHIKTKNFVHLE